VPQYYKTKDGYGLGQWVSIQRSTKNAMSPNRRQPLEALLGWSWNRFADKWEEGFAHLKEFSDQEGHCRVQVSYKTAEGYPLGQWVSVQRATMDTMDVDRRQRLEALPGWSWAVHLDKWEEGFSHLQEFSDREGHCRMSALYKTKGAYRLGQWVSVQRSSKDTMEFGRRQRLEALPGWVWDPFSDKWEEGLSQLKEFLERGGHSRVPKGYRTDDGYRLGQWVSGQRATKDIMDVDRQQRLEALPGWSWNTLADKWEEGCSRLKVFCEREGHCRVPKKYRTDGYRLGQWVSVQRATMDTMDVDRRQRLEALPGWVWKVEK
jgi:Helicase associated domain